MNDDDDVTEVLRPRPGGRPKRRAEEARSKARKKGPQRDRAEYMRKYRAQKEAERAAAAAAADEAERRAKSGIDPVTGVWTPTHPNQRPPFTSETRPRDANLSHGGRSPAKIGPVAAQIKHELLSDAECPDYLKDRIWGPAIDSWAHAEAVVRLLRNWLDQHDISDALTEFTEEDETIQQRGNKTRRRSTGRRVHSVIEQLRQAESRANTARQRLGLDPLSRARLGKDINKATFDLAKFLSETAPVAEVRGEISVVAELPAADAGGESGTAAAGQ